MTRPLEIATCRSVCAWDDTGDLLSGERLFACKGCGSEWVPSQRWTPIDSNGKVPDPVKNERDAGAGWADRSDRSTTTGS